MGEDFLWGFGIISELLEHPWGISQIHRSFSQILVYIRKSHVLVFVNHIPHCRDKSDMGVEAPATHGLENIEYGESGAPQSPFHDIVEKHSSKYSVWRLETEQRFGDVPKYFAILV